MDIKQEIGELVVNTICAGEPPSNDDLIELCRGMLEKPIADPKWVRQEIYRALMTAASNLSP